MNIGKFSKPVIVQVNEPTTDGTGFDVDDWQTHAKVWAKIEPMTGREFLGSEKVESDTTHKFMMRYTAGITPAMRISWDDRLFDIQSVINLKEENRFMVVMAVEHD